MVKLFGIIAIVAIIGVLMTGCGATDVSLLIRNASSQKLDISAGIAGVAWTGTLSPGESHTIFAQTEALEDSYSVHYCVSGTDNWKDKDNKHFKKNKEPNITCTIRDSDL